MDGEENDQLTPLSADNSIMEQILVAKTGEPSKFASFWEMDENDIEVIRFEIQALFHITVWFDMSFIKCEIGLLFF